MKGFDDSSKNGDDVGFGGEMGDSEQSLKLLHAYNNGSASHESHDGSMWEKVDEKSQPEDSEHGLEGAGEEGDGEDYPAVQCWIEGGVHHLRNHGRQKQRHDGDRSDGDLPRTPH